MFGVFHIHSGEKLEEALVSLATVEEAPVGVATLEEAPWGFIWEKLPVAMRKKTSVATRKIKTATREEFQISSAMVHMNKRAALHVANPTSSIIVSRVLHGSKRVAQ